MADHGFREVDECAWDGDLFFLFWQRVGEQGAGLIRYPGDIARWDGSGEQAAGSGAKFRQVVGCLNDDGVSHPNSDICLAWGAISVGRVA
jgi:hypothetical protein